MFIHVAYHHYIMNIHFERVQSFLESCSTSKLADRFTLTSYRMKWCSKWELNLFFAICHVYMHLAHCQPRVMHVHVARGWQWTRLQLETSTWLTVDTFTVRNVATVPRVLKYMWHIVSHVYFSTCGTQLDKFTVKNVATMPRVIIYTWHTVWHVYFSTRG